VDGNITLTGEVIYEGEEKYFNMENLKFIKQLTRHLSEEDAKTLNVFIFNEISKGNLKLSDAINTAILEYNIDNNA
jgi:uncharacterized protein (UPF0216 family)